jgi:hypothetical protein
MVKSGNLLGQEFPKCLCSLMISTSISSQEISISKVRVWNWAILENNPKDLIPGAYRRVRRESILRTKRPRATITPAAVMATLDNIPISGDRATVKNPVASYRPWRIAGMRRFPPER